MMSTIPTTILKSHHDMKVTCAVTGHHHPSTTKRHYPTKELEDRAPEQGKPSMYRPIPGLFTYVENPLMTRISSARHIMIMGQSTQCGSA